MSCEAARRERKTSGTLASNLTFMQTTGSGSDPWALIGWNFYKYTNQFDWFVWFQLLRRCRGYFSPHSFGKFCLSPPGKKIGCNISENCKRWLLIVSWLFVAFSWLALSFMKKNFKKNLWDQVSLLKSSEEIFIEKCSCYWKLFFQTLKRPVQSSHFTSSKFNANDEIPLFDLAHVNCGILSQTWEGFKFSIANIWIVIHKLWSPC